MKNKDIVLLVQAGILELTTLCLTPDEAYGFFKLRKSLRAAFEQVCSDEREMLFSVGIDDMQTFTARFEFLKGITLPSYADSAEMDRISKTLSEFNQLHSKLFEEDVEIKPFPLTYEKWRSLLIENKDKSRLHGKAEELLEGILWAAPADNQ